MKKLGFCSACAQKVKKETCGKLVLPINVQLFILTSTTFPNPNQATMTFRQLYPHCYVIMQILIKAFHIKQYPHFCGN